MSKHKYRQQAPVMAADYASLRNSPLQNIPLRTETGRMVREAIRKDVVDKPPAMSVDYADIEMRILAEIVKDPT